MITRDKKETIERAAGKMQQGRKIEPGSKCRDEDQPSAPGS